MRLRRLITSRTPAAGPNRLHGHNALQLLWPIRLHSRLPINPMCPKVEMIWEKRRDIIVRDRLLFNAEPPGSALASAEIAALDAFCSRNHGPIPDIAHDEWRLTVDGMLANPLTLTCDELAHRVHRILGGGDAGVRGQSTTSSGLLVIGVLVVGDKPGATGSYPLSHLQTTGF